MTFFAIWGVVAASFASAAVLGRIVEWVTGSEAAAGLTGLATIAAVGWFGLSVVL